MASRMRRAGGGPGSEREREPCRVCCWATRRPTLKRRPRRAASASTTSWETREHRRGEPGRGEGAAHRAAAVPEAGCPPAGPGRAGPPRAKALLPDEHGGELRVGTLWAVSLPRREEAESGQSVPGACSKNCFFSPPPPPSTSRRSGNPPGTHTAVFQGSAVARWPQVPASGQSPSPYPLPGTRG